MSNEPFRHSDCTMRHTCLWNSIWEQNTGGTSRLCLRITTFYTSCNDDRKKNMGLLQVRDGRGVDHPPTSRAEVKERVELYLYSLLGHSGSGCVVGIATGYGLDGPGIESRWGRDFPHLSRPTLGPTQPPGRWVKSGRGVLLTPHPF